MRFSTRTAILPAVLLALGIGVTASVLGPAAPAHAEAGYRVCGVYNSSTRGDLYGTGLAVKIYKGDNNNDTCSTKENFMRRYYGSAYRGSSGDLTFSMVTCETFASRIGYDDGDICFDMNVNKIYKYTSRFDARYPSRAGVSFWHD